MCLSEETLKAGGPFYLVSMPGEVIDTTEEVDVYSVTSSHNACPLVNAMGDQECF